MFLAPEQCVAICNWHTVLQWKENQDRCNLLIGPWGCVSNYKSMISKRTSLFKFMSTSFELAPKQWIPRNTFDYKWTIVHYNLSPCWPRSISPYGFTRPQCVNHLCFVVKVWEILSSRYTWHDDVIKWKHFPRYWPFVRGIHRWIPRTKDGDAELWCFLWSTPE